MNIYSRVFVFDTHPVMAEGVRCLMASFRPGVEVACAAALPEYGPNDPSAVYLVDKALNTVAIADWCGASGKPSGVVVVWGTLFTDAEALRLMQAGVRGLVARTIAPETLLECLDAVADGRLWVEPRLLPAAFPRRDGGSVLTTRERHVLDLVEAGLTNPEIAQQLGICPGTVKIHVKHIFEKTGIHGRYRLILSSRNRAQADLGAPGAGSAVDLPQPEPLHGVAEQALGG